MADSAAHHIYLFNSDVCGSCRLATTFGIVLELRRRFPQVSIESVIRQTRMCSIRHSAFILCMFAASCSAPPEIESALPLPTVQFKAIAPPPPLPLVAGETCDGVLVSILPSPESREELIRACYPTGSLDRSFSPGIVGWVPASAIPKSSSVTTFETEDLNPIGAENIEDISDFVPTLTIEKP